MCQYNCVFIEELNKNLHKSIKNSGSGITLVTLLCTSRLTPHKRPLYPSFWELILFLFKLYFCRRSAYKQNSI